MLVGIARSPVFRHQKIPEEGSYRRAVAIAAPDRPESLLPPESAPARHSVRSSEDRCRCRSFFIGALVAAKVGELPSVKIRR